MGSAPPPSTELPRRLDGALSACSGRTEFPAFPYVPYSIQLDFMRGIYETLDAGGVGLFESPTGTGKTLSLICSTLQWLEDRRSREESAATAKPAGPPGSGSDEADGLPDWVQLHSVRKERGSQQQAELRRARRLEKAQQKTARRRAKHGVLQEARLKEQHRGGGAEDADFLLEDWDSDADAQPAGSKRSALVARYAGGADSDSSSDADAQQPGEPMEQPRRRQVIFCSRTHSQLTQFVAELHRTPFANTLSMVALASRQALCINESVLKLGNAARINERCLDLQQAPPKKQATASPDAVGQAKAPAGGCLYLKAKPHSQQNFADTLLASPLDVEELARLGRRKGVCPYYAARTALPDADLVLLPYGALLLQETREALGVRLEGNVVIVDEAHNLVAAVNNSHSAVLTALQLQAAAAHLTAYFERFKSRLAPGNCRHIQTLLLLTAKLQAYLERPGRPDVHPAAHSPSAASPATAAMTVNDLLFSLGLDNVNMFRLIRYVKESKVLFKVSSYGEAQQDKAAVAAAGSGTRDASAGTQLAALQALAGFVSVLNNVDADGQVIINRSAGTLKFVLLNADAHFAKVVSAAHAVVLASGTLSPINAVTQALFPDAAPGTIRHFSCGHVVGRDQLLSLAVGTGPTGLGLNLTLAVRGGAAVLDEIGRALLNICQAVPQGVVAFFPSFAYADQLHSRWQQTGALAGLGRRKAVFREPRTAGEVEAMLQLYGAAALGNDGMAHKGGALLLCVVGGKMAEGINFGDGLGRCVVMVGLPYPNPTDSELRQRMRYLDACQRGTHTLPQPLHQTLPQPLHQTLPQTLPPTYISEAPGPNPQAAAALAAAARPASGQLSCLLPPSSPSETCSAAANRPATNPAGCLPAAGLAVGSSAPSGVAMTSDQPGCSPLALACAPADAAAQRSTGTAVASVTPQTRRGGGAEGQAVSAGREYCENLCMQAVNQCVGRVIRHQRDYAAIVLLDARYATPPDTGPARKLPEWVRQSLRVASSFGDAHGRLHRFFLQQAQRSMPPH